jgi:hypothetical protein
MSRSAESGPTLALAYWLSLTHSRRSTLSIADARERPTGTRYGAYITASAKVALFPSRDPFQAIDFVEVLAESRI